MGNTLLSPGDVSDLSFLFPWNSAGDIYYRGGKAKKVIPSELKPLVDAELLKYGQRKEELAAALYDILGSEYLDLIEELCSSRTLVLQTNKNSLTKSVSPATPGIYSKINTIDKPMLRHSIALPSNTIHECNPGRESFIFPAVPPSTETWPGIAELEIISAFPHPLLAAGGKNLFPYTHLNRMQSIVFPTAFKTNENMLVCAPTGAGKTDVALSAILRVVWSHCQVLSPDTDSSPVDVLQSSNLGQVYLQESQPPSSYRLTSTSNLAIRSTSNHHRSNKNITLKLNKYAFKVVYIAPMKALASEITQKYHQRLSSLGVTVQEYTGDTRLSAFELENANILVSTPEKWDVLTRNPAFADSTLGSSVKLIIIDEVHLLQDLRGSVLETIVARTLQYVEREQRIIRIVGLSATLPNYIDVAEWLQVRVGKGLFYFDSSFRPVPLKITLVGLAPTVLPLAPNADDGEDVGKSHQNTNIQKRPNINHLLDRELVQGLQPILENQHQALVFVHSRLQTVRIAKLIHTSFGPLGLLWKLSPPPRVEFKALHSLLSSTDGAVGIHHAGLSRSDRNTVEGLFRSRSLSVLVCTSTLAWGVNLPARAIFIRGTDVFKGGESNASWEDLSPLDVLQIFGRAGRPTLDDAGEATLLCPSSVLPKYLLALSPSNITPIESTFALNLDTHLNAEIALGTVRHIQEALFWLSRTFFWVRTRSIHTGRSLKVTLEQILQRSVENLVVNGLVFWTNSPNSPSSELVSTSLGEITSRLYLSVETALHFRTQLKHLSESINHTTPLIAMARLIKIFSEASEFAESIKMRSASIMGDPEEEELLRFLVGQRNWIQRPDVKLGKSHFHHQFDSWVPLFDATNVDWSSSATKVSILFQAYVSGWGEPHYVRKKRMAPKTAPHFESPDMNYIQLNASRILKALFDISREVIKHHQLSQLSLELIRCFELRSWSSHFLCLDHWWDSASLLTMALPDKDDHKALMTCLEEHYMLQSKAHSWSRVSPLLLTLEKHGELTQSPLVRLTNVTVRRVQDLGGERGTLYEFFWTAQSRRNHTEVWAVVSDPDSCIMWSDQFRFNKIMTCTISLVISSQLEVVYISLWNEQMLGLDLNEVPVVLFPTNPPSATMVSDGKLFGRGPLSSLFPPCERPFLTVSSICKNWPEWVDSLRARKILSFSALQSMLARFLIFPSPDMDCWLFGSKLITVLAPYNSGKTLLIEMAVWGQYHANPAGRVIIIAPDQNRANIIAQNLAPIKIFIPSAYIEIITPVDVLSGSYNLFTDVNNSPNLCIGIFPALILVVGIEHIGDNPEFEGALTLVRYWTHFLPNYRWLVLGTPFSCADDVVSWLSASMPGRPLSVFCGPEVSLSLSSSIRIQKCGPQLGSLCTAISRMFHPAQSLEFTLIWVHSRRFARILASKLSLRLATTSSLVGFHDETQLSFKDDLIRETMSQSRIAFYLPNEKDLLIQSIDSIKILIVPISALSFAMNVWRHIRNANRPVNSLLVFQHLHRYSARVSLSHFEFSLGYTPCQLREITAISSQESWCTFLGPQEICKLASVLVQTDDGYKLPIESQLIRRLGSGTECGGVDSTDTFALPEPLHQLVITPSVLVSFLSWRKNPAIPISEIIFLFHWTFLARRMKSNASYYYGQQDLELIIRKSLCQLQQLGFITMGPEVVDTVVTRLPLCKVAALHSISPDCVARLDSQLSSLLNATHP